MTELHPAPPETTDTSLHKGRLGIIGVVFFVVAAAAPLAGMTGALPPAIGIGNGAGAPGAYLAAGLVLLLFSFGYAAMSHKVTNTGAFFAFVGRGLGIIPGVGSAFVSLLAYLTVQWAVYGFFGYVVSSEVDSQFSRTTPWWLWSLLACVVVTALSLLSVDVGAKVLGVFMTLEVACLALLAVVLLVKGAPDGESMDLAASFSPSAVFAGGLTGGAGIALAFAFASFIGFEATAIYGEESKNPKRTVPLATYVAVGLITILFSVVSFGIVTGLGAQNIADKVAKASNGFANPAAVVFGLAEANVGPWLSTVMKWLVITSLFAALLAFQNSAARYFFAMGRSSVLPSMLDKTNKVGAPGNAAMLTSVLGFAIIVLFAATGQDPILNLFNWFSAVAVLAILLVEALVSLSVVAYFLRTKEDTRIWHTMIAPLLAFLGLIGAMFLVMSRFALLSGTAAEGVDPTAQLFGLNTVGWVLIGSPFLVLILGLVVGGARRRTENVDAVKDLVS